MSNNTIKDFYQSPEGLNLLKLTVGPDTDFYVQAGATANLIPITLPDINNPADKAALKDKLNEIAATLQVIEYGNSSFEIAIANSDVVDGDTMLHISTYSSAISNNAGNAYELAVQALLYPNHKHLYVASFGNGGTSALLPKDAKYAKKTGRFTKEQGDDTVALQSIQNLHSALDKKGLAITKIMGTDSAGGLYARAYALTLDQDQLQTAFFSEVSGIFGMSLPSILYKIRVKEKLFNARKNKEYSPDVGKIDAAKIALAQEVLGINIDSAQRQQLLSRQIGKIAKIGALFTSAQSLRRGPSKKTNPFVHDTNALLVKQPNAKITYGFAQYDPLYNPDKLVDKIVKLLSQLAIKESTGTRASVSGIIIPDMTHAYNTYFPGLYHAIQQHVLYR